MIVTPEVDAAQWARDHGYRIDVDEMEIGTERPVLRESQARRRVAFVDLSTRSRSVSSLLKSSAGVAVRNPWQVRRPSPAH